MLPHFIYSCTWNRSHQPDLLDSQCLDKIIELDKASPITVSRISFLGVCGGACRSCAAAAGLEWCLLTWQMLVQVVPHKQDFKFNGPASTVTLPPYSFSVITLNLSKPSAAASISQA